ncbi:LysR family transcriptional regulator [Zhengella mangrovi]|uniref:LysR family transcriptional regulator n=1 Tax=Zhengella mangrovi TaxID=1982044 RepID=A0A2G1QTA0_9HYPH|nr:LysR family transcriptional regulator [Zhengella mangrovi]PHP68753.1 LysR family transcriptional regulator [Zhengella mangrovi]
MSETLPNFRHLRVFREVARLRSVSAAAEQVHLSQPAVTQAVSKLEAELGASLFERRSDGMYLTAIGTAFLQRVMAALDHVEAGAREASRVGLRHAGRGFSRFDRLITSAQLRALAALSDSSNFSMAARALQVSQPSVHRAARNLEKVSGIELFKSAPEGVSLTHAAQALAQRTKLAFAELKQGFEEIGDHLGRDSSVITVGSLPLARSFIMPHAINAMVAARPSVQIRVIDGVYETLLARLRSGEIDFLIGALRHPPPVDDVIQERLFDDPLTIVAGAHHPLAGKTGISIAEILRWPWVAPPRPTPAGSYLFDTLRIHEREQTPVRVVSSSLALLRGLLTSGDYITIISTHQIRHEIEQGLLVPLDVELEASHRAIGLTFREGWRPTPAQSLFLDLVRDAARDAMAAPR